MKIPNSVKSALVEWAQAAESEMSAAEEVLAEALRAWIDTPMDGVAGDLEDGSHQLLSELQRLGRWSMIALLAKFLDDDARQTNLRKDVVLESQRLNAPNDVTNSVHTVIAKILKRNLQKGQDFRNPGAVDAYLREGCKNELLEVLRKRRFFVPLELDDSVGPEWQERETVEEVEERELKRGKADTHRYMRAKMKALPPAQRAMMTLSYHHKWEYSALADAFPVKPEGVPDDAPSRNTRAQQIRRELHEIYKEIASEVPDPWQ